MGKIIKNNEIGKINKRTVDIAGGKMGVWHGESGKKRTGGKINPHRKKRKFEIGGTAMHTVIGKEKKKFDRTKGGSIKVKSAAVESINVYDPVNRLMKKVKILEIVKTPSNPHLARRNIITKGSIINTELGLVKITSRPSQMGVASGVIVENSDKKER